VSELFLSTGTLPISSKKLFKPAGLAHEDQFAVDCSRVRPHVRDARGNQMLPPVSRLYSSPPALKRNSPDRTLIPLVFAMMNVLEWPGTRQCVSSKTVHAPALSSLDYLTWRRLGLCGTSERKAIHAGLGYGNLPAAAARAGSIELTDVIPKAQSSVRRSMFGMARILHPEMATTISTSPRRRSTSGFASSAGWASVPGTPATTPPFARVPKHFDSLRRLSGRPFH